MLNNLFIFSVALFMVIKGATLATKYATRLAENYRLSKYTIGFIIVAVISILPETFIAINSALKGTPSFGLATLFGTSIADMTLIFGIIIFSSRRNLKIESKILKNQKVYPFMLLLPLILGLNGHFSRPEGLALVVAGGIFYYFALRNGIDEKTSLINRNGKYKNFLMLIFSMVVLLAGSHFIVTSATDLAVNFMINPILIGMLVIGVGTTMPELFFSLRSVKKRDDSMAVGDILGTVLADVTIVVGILATIKPFSFPSRIIYISGMFMVASSFILFRFMKSGKSVTRKEALLLFSFWLVFVLVEFVANN